MKYFEDVRVGETAVLGSSTVSEAEILAFARKYDPQPFHTDPEAAKTSFFGGLIASGWHTCAIMMRISVEAMQRERAAGAGSPGIDSCRWLKPVRPGDRLTLKREILEAAVPDEAGRLRPEPVGDGQPEGRDGPRHRRHHHAEAPSGSRRVSDLVHFEDVEVGQTHRFGRYEVTAEEIVEYARQFDPQPFHVDEEAARHSQFGGLIASGWHTGAMLIRMVCESAIPGHATNGAIGFDDLKWLVPVRPATCCPSSTWSWRRSSRAAGATSASSRSRAAS